MAQIIKHQHKEDFKDVDRGNIASYLQTNPNGIPSSKPMFIRADGKSFSREHIFKESRQLAHALRHKLKLKEGDRIAIFSPNSCTYPTLVYAGLSAGVVLVPCNPQYSPEELVHPLKDASVQFIFAHPAVVANARKGLKLAGMSDKSTDGLERVWLLDDTDKLATVPDGAEKDARTLLGQDELAPIEVKDAAERTAFIAYSSGTSGKPKGVELTHKNMTSVSAAMVIGLSNDFHASSVALAVLPFQHIFALAKFIHFGALWGYSTVVLPKFDLELFLGAIQRFKVNLAILVPPIAVLLAKHPLVEKYDLSSITVILSGAAPLSKELGDEVEARIKNARVTQGYGLSETSPTATYMSIEKYRDFKGSCGELMPCVEARLVNDDGKDVGHEQGAEGNPGEIWLRGPTIMKGYLNNVEATRDCLTEDGWFKTGDIAIAKGSVLWIVDRKKELIKYKGFQVAPAELEAMLLRHPKVADAAVVGIYSEAEATEYPRAYIVPRADAGVDVKDKTQTEALSKEVRKWVDEKVFNAKRLRGGVIVEAAIEKSPSGKILRRIYKQRHEEEEKKKKKNASSSKL